MYRNSDRSALCVAGSGCFDTAEPSLTPVDECFPVCNPDAGAAACTAGTTCTMID
jgi:hypothetical protein